MKKPLPTGQILREASQIPSEPDSFEALYKQYLGQVYQKCLSMTKDAETAHDYTQDIFIKVFDNLDYFENRSSFSTWLYSISHNYCLDQLRIGRRLSIESLTDRIITPTDEQDPSVSTEYRLQTLEAALNYLTAEEVSLLRLHHEQGLSIKQIAGQYQLTESAVKMRLKRTRDKLYDLYKRHEQR